ncbi:LpxI family protein [Amorphus suaedae]
MGVIAGGGRLPIEVAEAIEAAGGEVVVAGIDGEADAVLSRPDVRSFRWGQIGGAIDYFASRNARDLVIVGTITRRPDFKALRLDAGTWRRLPRILQAIVGGDDSVVRKALRLIEAEGFRVRGIGEVAPALLAGQGTLGQHQPGAAAIADAEFAMRALAALGPFDVGQSAVVIDRRIVALEAAEGTDRMLARVAELRETGRIPGKRGGVLVKRAKPGQETRTELPTVGPVTVAAAVAAQLSGIVIEAGRTIIVDRTETIAAADAAGLFLVGMPGEGPVS